ncbi:3-phosphoshikimate 1-carboxyvinyltransferase [Ferrovum sp.]|uniref:3-phosphoshikimate 1-carboxyvinyltransferase n=1 Tax=Ferrovum sp. TaxID=2609467 RepID=UPI0026164751|nr:3-phosphoshikimate 1-carboxyvinyltransferase [Ferrovum sp.]
MSEANDTMQVYHVTPGGRLTGTIRVPGDKSISHRSIMLGALAEGITEVTGFLEGEDALATMNVFRTLGVQIEGPEQGRVIIHGVGLHGLKAPTKVLDCGNSGTSMRLLAGLLAAQPFDCTLTGDASLTQRPMARVADPLRLMGARLETAAGGRPPLKIFGTPELHGLTYTLPMASAQVKSALLLAGLYARGETVITEPEVTRDHTERMFEGFGVPVRRAGRTIRVTGGYALHATPIEVPGDISSAAFFLVGACIASGSDLHLQRVGVNPTRTGVLDILRLMGANLEVERTWSAGGEPLADLRVRAAPLRGITIPPELVPLAIDEFPALFIAAACAEGRTVLRGAAELRVKESDRIQVMADGLRALGVCAEVLPDGLIIEGGQGFGSGTVESRGDHRIAMSFAMAALCARGPIEIRDCANVATSFPGFASLARAVGLNLDAS